MNHSKRSVNSNGSKKCMIAGDGSQVIYADRSVTDGDRGVPTLHREPLIVSITSGYKFENNYQGGSVLENTIKSESVRLLLNKRIEEACAGDAKIAAFLVRFLFSDFGISWFAKRRQHDAAWHASVMRALDIDEAFRALLKLAQANNLTASTLLSEYVETAARYEWLEKYLQRAGVWESDIVDERQKVADRVGKNINNLREIDAFNGWVKRIAGTVAKVYRRVRQPEEELSNDVDKEIPPRSNAQLVIDQLWPKLSKHAREVLTVYLQDKSTQEVAEELGISVSSAKYRLRIARAEIRHLINSTAGPEHQTGNRQSDATQFQVIEECSVADTRSLCGTERESVHSLVG